MLDEMKLSALSGADELCKMLLWSAWFLPTQPLYMRVCTQIAGTYMCINKQNNPY